MGRTQNYLTASKQSKIGKMTLPGSCMMLRQRLQRYEKCSQLATILDWTIQQLTEHKQRTEKALEAKNIPLEVTLECLSIREHRVSIDLVRDEVEYELNKVGGYKERRAYSQGFAVMYRNSKSLKICRVCFTTKSMKPLNSSVGFRSITDSSLPIFMTRT